MGTSWLGGASIFLLIVVHLAATSGFGQFFFRHRRSAEVVLMQGDQIANDPVVELERALVLGQGGWLRAEARDDVVARLATSDLVRELAASPMRELQVGRLAEQVV